jgi:hypothetical protein
MADAALRDATLKDGIQNANFNDPNNWVEGYVPTGVATIPPRAPVTVHFQEKSTTFATFRSLGYGGFRVDAGQTVTLTGDGVTTQLGGDFAVFGIVRGAFHLKTTGFDHPTLFGTGTVVGDVESVGGNVNPGEQRYGGTGTLTIDGNYVQTAGPGIFSSLIIGAAPGQAAAALAITKRATLVKDDNSGLSIIAGGPMNQTFTALAAAGGLIGVFGNVVVSPGPAQPDVRYDAKNVIVTI